MSYTRDADTNTIISTVKDNLTGNEYQIRSRFLLGADGGRSQVARAMNAEFDSAPSTANAVNIIVEADCNHLMAGHEAQLHFCFGAPSQRKFGLISVIRMVKPWTVWLLVFIEAPGECTRPYSSLTKDDPELLQLARELIGDDTVAVKITRIDPWILRESVAKEFHQGRDVFIVR
jgi:2-polyprenyl-6-methoxyphenol hydroxylase-like FAD-dependent oxidoreductase